MMIWFPHDPPKHTCDMWLVGTEVTCPKTEWIYARGGVATSCGSSVFSFLRYLHTVFHCGRASLQSHQQCNVIPFLHNCSSICYKGIKKMWYIHTKEYYSAIKKNEIISFSAIWMQLEIIILSQGSQKEKDKYCGPSTYMWNLKYSTNEPIYK